MSEDNPYCKCNHTKSYHLKCMESFGDGPMQESKNTRCTAVKKDSWGYAAPCFCKDFRPKQKRNRAEKE